MYGMTTRSERIEARVAPERAERIRLASSLQGTSVSNFIINAASDAADQILADTQATVVTSDYFDSLLMALDAPAMPNENLRRAHARVAADPSFLPKS